MYLDVAVVCCLPLDEVEWSSRPRDFVLANAARSGCASAAALWPHFRQEAAFIRRKFLAFCDYGIEVFENADAEHIRRAALRHETVVVIAHWKDEFVQPHDIPDDWRSGESRLTLCEELNVFIRAGVHELGGEPAGIAAAIPPTVWCREQLDRLIPLRPGNRIETFTDQLTASQFADLFPSGFGGKLYCAVCHSHLLMEWFRRAHPHSTCLCTPAPTAAGLSIAKLHPAFAIMARKKVPLCRGLVEASDLIDSL